MAHSKMLCTPESALSAPTPKAVTINTACPSNAQPDTVALAQSTTFSCYLHLPIQCECDSISCYRHGGPKDMLVPNAKPSASGPLHMNAFEKELGRLASLQMSSLSSVGSALMSYLVLLDLTQRVALILNFLVS